MSNNSFENMKDITFTLSKIKDDVSVPKNVRIKIDKVVCCLNQEGKEIDLNVNEALQELDDLSNDPHLPVYTRVEILNIISALEVANMS
ncbi:MAG: UPF0147 family protein [Nanoarchaeota archaeon]|nr:UPF0147 family protein [Nanoarchaeota archaeon]